MKKLLIAVDYDGTYSADPETFDLVVSEFQSNGHECIMVTARGKQDLVKVNPNLGLKVYYTEGELKDPFMRDNHTIEVDIWIEDRPQSVGKVDDWKFDQFSKEWYKECLHCDGIGSTKTFMATHSTTNFTSYGRVAKKSDCVECTGTGRWVPDED